jgi:hypothetical protein
MLFAEVRAVELAVTDACPEPALGRSHFAAQFSRSRLHLD